MRGKFVACLSLPFSVPRAGLGEPPCTSLPELPPAVLSLHQPCPVLDALLSLQAEHTGAMTQALLPVPPTAAPFPFLVSLQLSRGLLGSPGTLQKPRKGHSSGAGIPAAALTPAVGRAAAEVPSLCCLTAPRWTSPRVPRSAGRRQRRFSATCTTAATCSCCPTASAPGGKATRPPGAEERDTGVSGSLRLFYFTCTLLSFESL